MVLDMVFLRAIRAEEIIMTTIRVAAILLLTLTALAGIQTRQSSKQTLMQPSSSALAAPTPMCPQKNCPTLPSPATN
jgi:hypothetical protein